MHLLFDWSPLPFHTVPLHPRGGTLQDLCFPTIHLPFFSGCFLTQHFKVLIWYRLPTVMEVCHCSQQILQMLQPCLGFLKLSEIVILPYNIMDSSDHRQTIQCKMMGSLINN